MPTRAEVATRTTSIIAEHLERPVEDAKESATLIDDLGADSLDLVEISFALEEEFDITISDDDSEHLMTVGHAVELVAKLVGAE